MTGAKPIKMLNPPPKHFSNVLGMFPLAGDYSFGVLTVGTMKPTTTTPIRQATATMIRTQSLSMNWVMDKVLIPTIMMIAMILVRGVNPLFFS